MQCGNNLKQLGLALHNYHSALGSLPPLEIYFIPIGEFRATWATLILPYLEQDGLFGQADVNQSPAANVNQILRETFCRLICPSDIIVGLSSPSVLTDQLGTGELHGQRGSRRHCGQP